MITQKIHVSVAFLVTVAITKKNWMFRIPRVAPKAPPLSPCLGWARSNDPGLLHSPPRGIRTHFPWVHFVATISRSWKMMVSWFHAVFSAFPFGVEKLKGLFFQGPNSDTARCLGKLLMSHTAFSCTTHLNKTTIFSIEAEVSSQKFTEQCFSIH